MPLELVSTYIICPAGHAQIYFWPGEVSMRRAEMTKSLLNKVSQNRFVIFAPIFRSLGTKKSLTECDQ